MMHVAFEIDVKGWAQNFVQLNQIEGAVRSSVLRADPVRLAPP